MNWIDKQKKILILAPHTDDAEFGMGGSIAKFIESGLDVYCAAFSACTQSVHPEFPEDILKTEVRNASAILGLPKSNLFLYEYEVRTFSKFRQEILDDLIQLREKINPDVVFIPTPHDVHQDHKVVADEGIRAFKFKGIFCYELPWNNFTFTNTCFSVLTEAQVQRKADAIAEYKSQAHRPYANSDFVWSLAKTRGIQVNESYAECFEIIRYII